MVSQSSSCSQISEYSGYVTVRSLAYTQQDPSLNYEKYLWNQARLRERINRIHLALNFGLHGEFRDQDVPLPVRPLLTVPQWFLTNLTLFPPALGTGLKSEMKVTFISTRLTQNQTALILDEENRDWSPQTIITIGPII